MFTKRISIHMQMLVVIVGIVLSSLSSWFLYKMEENVIFNEFQKEVNDHAALLYRELSLNVEVLRALAIMFDDGVIPDSKKFQSIAKQILNRHHDIQALEWIPKVKHFQRRAFELRRRQEFPNFEFTERQKQGKMMRAQDRLEYFPVYYVEPYFGNEAALGFDLASNATRYETLERSRNSNKPLATASITLVQEKGSQKGFLVFLPIYEEITISKASVYHDKLLGFILGVYRIGDIFHSSIHSVEPLNIKIELVDETLPSHHDVLYTYIQVHALMPAEHFTYRKELPEIFGRKWSIVASPSLSYVAEKRSSQALITFISGIVFTFFLVSYIHIISKRTLIIQRLSNELKNEQEKLFVTLRSIGDGVITTNLAGKITFINKMTEEITGWSQTEAVDKHLYEVFNIVDEKTGKVSDNPVDKVINTGEIIGFSNHIILIAKDGSKYAIEECCAPIFDQQGEIKGTVLVYRDVTEKKRMTQELIKIKKLESIGVLAGGIAHDFNNFLAGVLGNIEQAEMLIDSTNKAYPFLKMAKKASIRAKDLTQQLLTFAKGGGPVKHASSIAKIIADSAKFSLHGSSVSCTYRFPDDLWSVNVDASQISQVIQNIVINARYAMSDVGVIEFCCENISDICEAISLPAKKYIKLSITDTGSGISEEFIDKIFDPYFSTKQEGSGLGLAICHSIIRSHDGKIDVSSKKNKGTTFTIYLPASIKKIEEVDLSNVVVSEININATIMYMDDDYILRDLLDNMLTRLGHKVVLAENGQEAIAIYNDYYKAGRNIDLIIMDLTIPGAMGGKETIGEILKINPDANVVVASGYCNDSVMSHYKDYGFKASIVKPFQLAELKVLIDNILA